MPVCYFRVPGAALTSYKYNRPLQLYTALLSSHFSGMTHSLDPLISNCIYHCLNVFIHLSLWAPTNTITHKFYSSLLSTHSSRLTHSLKYNRPYKLQKILHKLHFPSIATDLLILLTTSSILYLCLLFIWPPKPKIAHKLYFPRSLLTLTPSLDHPIFICVIYLTFSWPSHLYP